MASPADEPGAAAGTEGAGTEGAKGAGLRLRLKEKWPGLRVRKSVSLTDRLEVARGPALAPPRYPPAPAPRPRPPPALPLGARPELPLTWVAACQGERGGEREGPAGRGDEGSEASGGGLGEAP